MFSVIDAVKKAVRRFIHSIAVGLDKASGGSLTPNAVTIVGLLAHIPIAWLIATNNHAVLAAILLIIFGLFDVLDGELARVQKSASAAGMLLDATTDRIKETMLYMAIAYVFMMHSAIGFSSPWFVLWTIAACGASLSVSYVKAKGEAVVAASGRKIDHATLNHMFSGGLLSFEVRMTILVVALLVHTIVALETAVVVIAVVATLTVLQRLIRITEALSK